MSLSRPYLNPELARDHSHPTTRVTHEVNAQISDLALSTSKSSQAVEAGRPGQGTRGTKPTAYLRSDMLGPGPDDEAARHD